jgi:hypothetical protein
MAAKTSINAGDNGVKLFMGCPMKKNGPRQKVIKINGLEASQSPVFETVFGHCVV